MRKDCPECHYANHAGKVFCGKRLALSSPRVGACFCKYGAPQPRAERRYTINKKRVREAVKALQGLAA